MNKKHFIQLADLVRGLEDRLGSADGSALIVTSGRAMLDTVKGQLAEFCRQQNPAFNRERWLGYIAGENGPSGGKV